MNGVLHFEDLYFDDPEIEKIMDNLDSYSLNELFAFASINSIYQKKILDFLLIKSALNDQDEILKINMINLNLYESYINRTVKSNNNFMKAYVSIFFEEDLIDLLFNSEIDLVNIIFNDKKHSFNAKICPLITFSQFNIEEDTFKLIKKLIKTDKDLKKDYTTQELNNLLNEYLQTMDKNRENMKKELKLEY